MQLDFNATTMTETQTAPVEEDLKLKEASKNPNEAIEIDDDDMEEGIVYFAILSKVFLQAYVLKDSIKEIDQYEGMLVYIQSFVITLKVFGFLVSIIWSGMWHVKHKQHCL